MSNLLNRHGLPRRIPKSVKRAVRQRDGFGCIICGRAIFDYEHFDPEYADAMEHNVNDIILLCSEHHDLKTRGFLSRDTIRGKIGAPKCKEYGFSFGPFDIGTLHPEIVIGRMRCTNVASLITFQEEEVFAISPLLSEGLPFRINAKLRDTVGNITLEIVNNEWRTRSNNWDVEISGSNIMVRSGPREIVLILRSEPPHRIVVERLEMHHLGNKLSCRDGGDFQVETRYGQTLRASELVIDGCRIAIEANERHLAVGIGGGSISFSGSVGSQRPRFPINFGFIGKDVESKILRIGRCACGSGLRYKHCHGKIGSVL